jgi:hypothetical protein
MPNPVDPGSGREKRFSEAIAGQGTHEPQFVYGLPLLPIAHNPMRKEGYYDRGDKEYDPPVVELAERVSRFSRESRAASHFKVLRRRKGSGLPHCQEKNESPPAPPVGPACRAGPTPE